MKVEMVKIEIRFYTPITIKEIRSQCKELENTQENMKSVRPILFESPPHRSGLGFERYTKIKTGSRK